MMNSLVVSLKRFLAASWQQRLFYIAKQRKKSHFFVSRKVIADHIRIIAAQTTIITAHSGGQDVVVGAE